MLDMRDRQPIWPLLTMAVTLAFLVIPVAIGGPGARLGALCAMGAILVGFGAGLRRVRREHDDDPRPPSFAALARESTASSGRMLAYVAGYIVLVFLVAAAPGSGPRRESGGLGILVAAAAGALLAATLVDGARFHLRREGVERDVFFQSTSVAFFATVIAAVWYALFEVFADAPELSMWTVWSFGMLAWAMASAVLRRRRA